MFERLRDAAPTAVMHEPPANVAPTPNRKAREAQHEFIQERSQRLLGQIDKCCQGILSLRLEEDAELVHIRGELARLAKEIERVKAASSHFRSVTAKLQAELCGIVQQIAKLEEVAEGIRTSVAEAEAGQSAQVEVQTALQLDLAASFAQEAPLYLKRAKQIEYLEKQKAKYQRRLGHHQMRTDHLVSEE